MLTLGKEFDRMTRMLSATATASAIAVAPAAPRGTGLTAEQQLEQWLVESGTLRRLAQLKASHIATQKAEPWLKGSMLIQRFRIPDKVAFALGNPSYRNLQWQGGQLCVEAVCHVLISEQRMNALFEKYCSKAKGKAD